MKKLLIIGIAALVIYQLVGISVERSSILAFQAKIGQMELMERDRAELQALVPRVAEGLTEELFDEEEAQYVLGLMIRIRDAEAAENGFSKNPPISKSEAPIVIEKLTRIVDNYGL